jgi:hypothetical protein
MNIKEDVPVTTTANAGAGMDDPKLPIKQKNIFRRVSNLISRKSQVVAKFVND